MKGLIPPLVLTRFLQRQPLAIHYMRQCIAEEAKKHPPLNPARFFLRTHSTSPAETKTSDKDEERKEEDSLSSAEFSGNGLGSFVFVSTSSKQYEEPVGISEFIGYNTAPRMKRRQRRRHRCCQSSAEQQDERGGGGAGGGGGGGGNLDSFFSSGSCEECRARVGSVDNFGGAGGWGGRNRYRTSTS